LGFNCSREKLLLISQQLVTHVTIITIHQITSLTTAVLNLWHRCGQTGDERGLPDWHAVSLCT